MTARRAQRQNTPSSRGNIRADHHFRRNRSAQRGEVRAARHRQEVQFSRFTTLIDKWGNERRVEQTRSGGRTKHNRVLSILEERALRYRNRSSGGGNKTDVGGRSNSIDETGTVDTDGLTEDDDSMAEEETALLSAKERELLEACKVDDDLLRVHGVLQVPKLKVCVGWCMRI